MKLKESEKLLLEVYADGNAPVEIRDMAAIIYVDNFDNEADSVILENISKKDRPFSLIAKEMKANKMFENKEYAKAVSLLQSIKSDSTATPSMVQRVLGAVNYIESKFIPKNEK
jgi:hypothetical protein